MQDPTAQQLQDDLEFMRRMYARRGPLNRPKAAGTTNARAAWIVLAVISAAPALAALLLKLCL